MSRAPAFALASIVLSAAIAGGCRTSPSSSRAAPSAAPSASLADAGSVHSPHHGAVSGPIEIPPNATPMQRLALAAVERANVAFVAWKGCKSGPEYATLRRALAAAEPFIRAGSRLSADVFYGPRRPSNEGAGAIAGIDLALAAGDCPAVEKQRFQLQSAITLAGSEIGQTKHLAPPRVAQGASDSAYELGLALFDARTAPSSFDEGQRADVLGIVEAIEASNKAFGDAPPAELAEATKELANIKATVEAAESMAKLEGRAKLARATGAIGLSIRRAGKQRGYRFRPPYRLPEDAEDASISCLTLPPPRVPIPPALAALGKRLFEDTRLSPKKKRACSSCHDATKGYADGRPTPETLVQETDPRSRSVEATTPLVRNTPTLLYDGLAATQLWDGRIVTAETQALRVIHNRAELGLGDSELVERVSSEPAYVTAFEALPEHEITPQTIGKALGAYVATLGSGTSPVDAFGHGDDAALSPELARGLDVFAGVGRCARCHIPPLWGGSRPTDFAVPVYANIGTIAAPGKAELDDDLGRAGVTKRDRDRGSFKTPTVRDLTKTAPYMHNGKFATLEDVVDFYDKGGGRGAGVDIPMQDPDVLPLHLTPEDRRALLLFLREGLKDRP